MVLKLDKDLSNELVTETPYKTIFDLAQQVQALRNELKEQRHEMICDILTDGL